MAAVESNFRVHRSTIDLLVHWSALKSAAIFEELFEGGFEVFDDFVYQPVGLLTDPGQTLVLRSNALLLRSRSL
jgi:hypothetical protein